MSKMSGAMQKGRIAHIVLFLLLLVSWLLQLGGTAGYHDESGDSSKDMRQAWWAVWFEFCVLVLNVAGLFLGLTEWHGALIALSTMASAYLMVIAEMWLLTAGRAQKGDSAAEAAAAGTIMVTMINIVIIILLSNPKFRGEVASKVENINVPVSGAAATEDPVMDV